MWRSPSDVVRAAAIVTGRSVDEICGPSKYRALVVIRSAICIVARRDYRCSYPRIGAAINRDHTTALHLERKTPLLARGLHVANQIREQLALPTFTDRVIQNGNEAFWS